MDLPWLCAGDFNEVLHATEQFGGRGRTERQMEDFREAVEECGFVDLGFIGLPYTGITGSRMIPMSSAV